MYLPNSEFGPDQPLTHEKESFSDWDIELILMRHPEHKDGFLTEDGKQQTVIATEQLITKFEKLGQPVEVVFLYSPSGYKPTGEKVYRPETKRQKELKARTTVDNSLVLRNLEMVKLMHDTMLDKIKKEQIQNIHLGLQNPKRPSKDIRLKEDLTQANITPEYEQALVRIWDEIKNQPPFNQSKNLDHWTAWTLEDQLPGGSQKELEQIKKSTGAESPKDIVAGLPHIIEVMNRMNNIYKPAEIGRKIVYIAGTHGDTMWTYAREQLGLKDFGVNKRFANCEPIIVNFKQGQQPIVEVGGQQIKI